MLGDFSVLVWLNDMTVSCRKVCLKTTRSTTVIEQQIGSVYIYSNDTNLDGTFHGSEASTNQIKT